MTTSFDWPSISQLVGFTRVPLEPGETRSVRFCVHPSQLAFYDRTLRFVLEPGAFQLRAGGASDACPARADVRVAGEVRQLDPQQIVPTRVSVHG